ncbi:G-type lectin S-receptor-like serine/threonine-protein kinase SD2-5 [Nymphaea colorata]|nr:G-type lectin S-receptor-like serine/threonine-protein kinase SD2-5 [Nymphaea colorata]
MPDLTAIAISLLLSLNFQLDAVHSKITIGKISPGLRGNNFDWIDDNGVFLSSVNRTFTLGLLNQPSEGTNYYLVITHRPSTTIIWTANRDSPVSSSDFFAFSADGEATLTSSEGGVVWRTNTKGLGVTAMELQESGNLMVLNSTEGVVWQSFDFPTDTLVSGQVLRPGMRLVSRVATTSGTNLSSGGYVLQMQQGDLSLLAEFQPVQKYWSLQSSSQRTKLTEESPETAVLTNSGWVFYGPSGNPALKILFPGGNLPSSSMVFATLTSDGSISFSITDSTTSSSGLVTMSLSIPAEFCDRPSPCGSYFLCSTDGVCTCPQALSTLYGSGCYSPQSPFPSCRSSPPPASFYRVGGGLTYFGVKFQAPKKVSGFQDCKTLCQTNCSCNALFFQNKSNACYIWGQIGSLQLATTMKDSFDLYVRSLTPAATDDGEARKSNSSLLVPIIAVTVVMSVGIFVLAVFLLIHKARKKRDEAKLSSSDEEAEDIEEMVPGMPRRFKFGELQLATDNFKNVVGKGGFGCVFEGWMPDGQRVAVKQLQKIGQGKKQFQAEVATIGSIHHLHLMRLKGFCAEGKQRLLIYDFMPNGSLDKFLFNKRSAGAASGGTNTGFLDWKKRFGIAVGTAKGLAYLHEECAVRIIHCDVKPENILLDANFSPKISDFGLAKLLSLEESQAFTTMRGTRGYLAPEWLTTSAVSTKSDIYSYGMVLLELVGGRKNLDPSATSSEKFYFPVYAYQMQAEGRVKEVVDGRLGGDVDVEEVERCIKVAMWCVQEDWNLRPRMGTVVKMLTGSVEIPALPPTPPTGFRLHLSMLKGEVSSLSGSGEEKTASSTTTNDTSENAGHGVLSSYELSGPR